MSVGPATPGLLPAQAERDAVAFLGLLSFLYLTWDPPIRTGAGVNDVTHHAGLNIGAIVVDNIDGEVLGIARNVIHSAESPVEHAEQRVIRAAIQRLHAKRARSETISVEQYYRGSLFYGPGVATRDFIDSGRSS